MQNIGVLLLCLNRKEKTLKVLNGLFKPHRSVKDAITIFVCHTIDTTGDAVRTKYSNINSLQDTEKHYCPAGKRNSWKQAFKKKHNAYLVLNKEIETYPSFIEELLETDFYYRKNYNYDETYIDTAVNGQNQGHSYGENILNYKYSEKYVEVFTDKDNLQQCKLSNTNINCIYKQVIKKSRMITEWYAHGPTDLDDILKLKKKSAPVFISPNIFEICSFDFTESIFPFHQLSFSERMKKVHDTICVGLKSNILVMSKVFSISSAVCIFGRMFKNNVSENLCTAT